MGSSLIVLLTTYLVNHALKIMNYQHFAVPNICLLPLCTGMSLSLVFQTLKANNPHAKYVIVTRIDQKTCLKSIVAANLIPLVIENIQEGDTI